MSTALTGTRRKATYGDVLQTGNSGAGVSSSLLPVRDGLGIATAFSISTTSGGFLIAPPATANRGLLSLGAGPFDGTTTGFFVGSALGTHIAINAASGYAGDFFNGQLAGVSVIRMAPTPSGASFTSNFFTIAGTFPATRTVATAGVNWTLATAGTSAQTLIAFELTLNPGFTGDAITMGLDVNNNVAGIGEDILYGNRNVGLGCYASATTIGTNIAGFGRATGGNIDVGLVGVCNNGKSGATEVGVIGVGLCAGAGVSVGGYFGLHPFGIDPVFTSAGLTSGAVLICDDGNVAVPMFVARHNGTPIVKMTGAPTGAATTSNFLNVTGTYPASHATTIFGVSYQLTTAGNSAFTVVGVEIDLLAGYTGSSGTVALNVGHTVAGTGTAILVSPRNAGISGAATATTTGTNIGLVGQSSGGNINVGVLAKSIGIKDSASNAGLIAVGLNTGLTPIQVGAFIGLQQTDPALVSCALQVTNGATSLPVAVFQVGTVAKFTIDANGYPVILSGSGAPGGTPADGALYVDTTNFKLYFRCGGAWKSVTGT